MTVGQFLLVALLVMLVTGVGAAFWLDVLLPRQQREDARKDRRRLRRASRIRHRIWMTLFGKRNTRLLTDQREDK